jgi:hypothetical protein
MVQINSSEDKILSKISDLRTWKSWNEFVYPSSKKDPKAAPDSVWVDYLRVDGNEISGAVVDRDHFSTVWSRNNRMFVGEFIIYVKNGSPVLIWTMQFHVKWYPWEKLASMFYDKQLGPVMERSLVRLRDELQH